MVVACDGILVIIISMGERFSFAKLVVDIKRRISTQRRLLHRSILTTLHPPPFVKKAISLSSKPGI